MSSSTQAGSPLILLFGLALSLAVPANAQRFTWTDTTAQTPQAEIYRTWLRYVASIGGQYRVASFRPSPFWLSSEQQRWRVYAMALAYLPDGATPEVLSIEPDSAGVAVYRVAIRFRSADTTNAMRSREVRVTVFAVRSGDGWVFANALPRLTRTWRRDTVGQVSYVIQPGYAYDRARAEQAVAFVDSLASALGVPRPDQLTYYLASTEDEVYRIIGLETDRKWGPVGGFAQPTNYQLFSGIPAVGEYYRHELTHVVILPLMTGRTLYFVSEGIPTWVGGTTGMDFPTAARALAAFLRSHPDIGLDSILTGHYPVAQFYPAGGVFVAMAYARGGTDAVKALFDGGPTWQDFRTAMERLFSRSWAEIASEWRRRALSFGPEQTSPP